MAFESLSERLQEIFKKLRGKGKLTEKDIKEAMREVKVALLEADVNFKVVKDFINSVTEKALGQEVMESLTPGQQVIKIVNDELIALMGSTQSRLNIGNKVPAVIMMVGLQGSGKTTACGKLANLLKKQGKNPLLVACDVVRPAAIKQLQVVGANVNVPVFTMGDKANPVDIAKASIDYARSHNSDVIIIDTAGRLHIDEELMEELVNIKRAVQPDEILLVVDAMTGQDAVNVASSFNERLDITGVILTKLDGDTRGGAALSIKAVTQKPIKYVGTGEKLTDLEPFYPDRMASRILGMGDVLTLIEKAQAAIDEKKAQELGQKLLTKQFTLEDFLEQLQSLKNMGPLDQLLSMIPGMNKNMLKNVDISEKDLKRIEAIIQSMTKEERQNPSIINGSRKKRIAKGKMMKKFADIDKDLKKGKMRLPFFR
jgi:signal recognition particle subunit SRP54